MFSPYYLAYIIIIMSLHHQPFAVMMSLGITSKNGYQMLAAVILIILVYEMFPAKSDSKHELL